MEKDNSIDAVQYSCRILPVGLSVDVSSTAVKNQFLYQIT